MSYLIQPVFKSQSITYLLSQLFATMAYYGFRGTIVVHLIDGGFGFSQDEVLQVYGFCSLAICFARFMGGVIGDLLLKSKWATVVGAFTQGIGALLLCFHSVPLIFIGVLLILIGNGLYWPNLIAGLGRIYHHEPRSLDSIFTLVYLVINLGAVLSVALLSLEFGKEVIFAICGVWFFVSGVFSLISKKIVVGEPDNKKGIGSGRQVLLVISAIVVATGFWMGYDFFINLQNYFMYDLEGIESKFFDLEIYQFGQWTGILFLIIFFICWLFLSPRRWVKVVVGGLLTIVAFTQFAFAFYVDNQVVVVLMLSSTILLAIAEALLIPTFFSLVSRWSNPKYLATMLGVYTLPMVFAIGLQRIPIDREEFGLPIFVGLIVLILLGVTTKVVYGVIVRNDNKIDV